MFKKILIANRGEIACRIIDTCRRLGVATVAVYSDADAGARHVRLADEALHIGPAAAVESYLSITRIIDAARVSGAVAIHPGYGFLAENASFASACGDAGLIFIGPKPETISKMGSKAESKKLMEAAEVPTIPGYHGEDQSEAALSAAANEIGYPLLVKASAGGGGKGMRIVHAPDQLADAVVSARREAASAFGDTRLLLERYLSSPRHIEFQVFGDSHGQIVHLYDRECSIQRRYQKIIEESPSPFLDDTLRQQMGAAAVAAAAAVDYENAGTIEFIVDAQRNFYFLEMNTRLQVEHPITELVTGQDLVEWQLRVASGQPLPLTQDAIPVRGHAIEARIYAENPDQGFIPSTGRVHRFATPLDTVDSGGVRLDTGFEDGDTITIHYDPMIAKLICNAEDRPTALTRLRKALAHTAVFGPVSNLALLRRIAADPVFAAGEADTGYIDANLEKLLRVDEVDPVVWSVGVAAEMLSRERQSVFARSPWDIADGWQANGRTRNRMVLSTPGQPSHCVDVAGRCGRYTLKRAGSGVEQIRVRPSGNERLMVESGQSSAAASVLRYQDQMLIAIGDQATQLRLSDPYAAPETLIDSSAHPGSPMPGRIVALKVGPGDRVAKDQALVVLEGMKMEFTVRARSAGTVERVLFDEGDMVDAEVPLVDISPLDEATA